MIYRNTSLSRHIAWNVDETPEAIDIARQFLRSECELLRLAGVAGSTHRDLEIFLASTAGLPLVVERSAAGDVLVHNEEVNERLLITGKTAKVLGSYIDCRPVRTEDRGDMTLRRQLAFSA